MRLFSKLLYNLYTVTLSIYIKNSNHISKMPLDIEIQEYIEQMLISEIELISVEDTRLSNPTNAPPRPLPELLAEEQESYEYISR